LLFAIGGYLSGSIPTAFLLARWGRDIDIREQGSGNVGGSNLRATIGVWATIGVGLFDIAKAAVPVWLAQQAGLDDTAITATGLAAVAGHNWSLWLGFQGGRGIASTLGVLLVRFPVGVAWILGTLALGALLKEVALFNGLGVLTLPVLSLSLNEPAWVVYLSVALAILAAVKRLEANRGFHVEGDKSWVLAHRLLYDRDP
jgi:glycerol-3-phosphate acyltransferase PlsY